MTDAPYHHGDLRAALLTAAEDELAERGADRFSLRSVARRANVSHAAPAHHFGDKSGLLSALAARGYERFLETQKARQAKAPPDPVAQMLESGLGYIDFALAHPALFRMMFTKSWPADVAPELQATSEAAFRHLVANVSALRGTDAQTDPAGRRDLVGVWAMVHGLADLMIAGGPKFLTEAPEAEREAMLREIIRRSIGPARA